MTPDVATLEAVIAWLETRAAKAPPIASIVAVLVEGLRAHAPWKASCDGTPAESSRPKRRYRIDVYDDGIHFPAGFDVRDAVKLAKLGTALGFDFLDAELGAELGGVVMTSKAGKRRWLGAIRRKAG